VPRSPFPALILALLPAAASAEPGAVQPWLDLETGAIWASKNDVRIPGDSGTLFSMAGGDFQTATAPYVRLQVGGRLGRHALSATFAPVRLKGNGTSGNTILFKDQVFTASADTTASYKFDTYRLTYRYAFVSTPRWEVALGATALLRDAEVKLSQPGRSSAEKNVGVVPLLSFRLAVGLAGPLRLALDGDALAAKQGRAEDVALGLEFDGGDLTFRAGYRVIEGGSDTAKVYNFAWLNHAMVGVRYAP
jgi:hypothetical protein